MLKLLVGIQELDRYQGVGLFDGDRPALIKALNLVDDCNVVRT